VFLFANSFEYVAVIYSKPTCDAMLTTIVATAKVASTMTERQPVIFVIEPISRSFIFLMFGSICWDVLFKCSLKGSKLIYGGKVLEFFK